jgi:hypothetical protein
MIKTQEVKANGKGTTAMTTFNTYESNPMSEDTKLISEFVDKNDMSTVIRQFELKKYNDLLSRQSQLNSNLLA